MGEKVTKRLFQDRRGQGMTEYVIILALIAVAAIQVVRTYGGEVKTLFGNMSEKVEELNSDID